MGFAPNDMGGINQVGNRSFNKGVGKQSLAAKLLEDSLNRDLNSMTG